MLDIEDEIIKNEEYSGDCIPFFREGPEDDPQNLPFKRLHNKLASEAQKRCNEANIQADKLNKEFTPKFNWAKIVKQIPSWITIFIGIITTLLGFLLAQEQGYVYLNLEVLGITSAGFGVFIAGICSLMSLEDDTYHLLLVARANQDHLLADALMIETQLSFLKIELIDLKRNYMKRLPRSSPEDSNINSLDYEMVKKCAGNINSIIDENIKTH